MGAIAIGIGVAIVSYAACTFLKPALGYDDSLDVFGVHALGGAWGALASGIFAVTLGSGIESNAQQIMVQLKGIVFVAIFAPVATVAIILALKLVFGSLRVADEDEGRPRPLPAQRERLRLRGIGAVAPELLGQGGHVGAISMAPAHERVA